jgi:hypothetical protein
MLFVMLPGAPARRSRLAAWGGVRGAGSGSGREGGLPGRPEAGRFALATITAAFGAATCLPEWPTERLRRFTSSVSAGVLIAASTIWPNLITSRLESISS